MDMARKKSLTLILCVGLSIHNNEPVVISPIVAYPSLLSQVIHTGQFLILTKQHNSSSSISIASTCRTSVD